MKTRPNKGAAGNSRCPFSFARDMKFEHQHCRQRRFPAAVPELGLLAICLGVIKRLIVRLMTSAGAEHCKWGSAKFRSLAWSASQTGGHLTLHGGEGRRYMSLVLIRMEIFSYGILMVPFG